MSSNLIYRKILIRSLLSFLSKHYHFYEFPEEGYSIEWEEDDLGKWRRVDAEIQEFCFIIPIAYDRCIKLYSSIKRTGEHIGESHDKGKDAVRLVAADTVTLEPI